MHKGSMLSAAPGLGVAKLRRAAATGTGNLTDEPRDRVLASRGERAMFVRHSRLRTNLSSARFDPAR